MLPRNHKIRYTTIVETHQSHSKGAPAMQPIHLWLSVYDRQTKKPKRQLQPVLPIITLAYRESLNHSTVTETKLIALSEQASRHEEYISQLKQWEREGYFTIEERRFGSMTSRIYHLEQKALQALQELKEYNDRIDLHMPTSKDLHYLTFSVILNDRQPVMNADRPWAEAASLLISKHQN